MGLECIKNPRRRCICLWVTLLVLLLGVVFLILGLTIFKVKDPVMTINSAALRDLDLSLELPLRVVFNVTLDIGISMRNPNRVAFKYAESSSFLRYRGNNVGYAPISAGRIGARHTAAINVSLTLMADNRLISNATLRSDVIAGAVPLQNYMRIPGKVRILFVNIHAVVYSTCDFLVHVTNRSLSAPTCHYRTKI